MFYLNFASPVVQQLFAPCCDFVPGSSPDTTELRLKWFNDRDTESVTPAEQTKYFSLLILFELNYKIYLKQIKQLNLDGKFYITIDHLIRLRQFSNKAKEQFEQLAAQPVLTADAKQFEQLAAQLVLRDLFNRREMSWMSTLEPIFKTLILEKILDFSLSLELLNEHQQMCETAQATENPILLINDRQELERAQKLEQDCLAEISSYISLPIASLALQNVRTSEWLRAHPDARPENLTDRWIENLSQVPRPQARYTFPATNLIGYPAILAIIVLLVLQLWLPLLIVSSTALLGLGINMLYSIYRQRKFKQSEEIYPENLPNNAPTPELSTTLIADKPPRVNYIGRAITYSLRDSARTRFGTNLNATASIYVLAEKFHIPQIAQLVIDFCAELAHSYYGSVLGGLTKLAKIEAQAKTPEQDEAAKQAENSIQLSSREKLALFLYKNCPKAAVRTNARINNSHRPQP